MIFKKEDSNRRIENLNRNEFMRTDIDFSKTYYGKKLYFWSIIPIIMTVVVVILTFSDDLINGYIDITNIAVLLMIGLSLTAIVKIMYYQNLANYYNHSSNKKE